MNFIKPKSFISGIVIAAGVFFVFSSSGAAALSASIFPETLNGLLLVDLIKEAEKDYTYLEITEAFRADYLAEDWNNEIVVLFWRFGDEESAGKRNGGLIADLKADYSQMFNRVDWEVSRDISVRDYQAKAINYMAYSESGSIYGGVMSVVVRDYLIVVSLMSVEKMPSVAEMKNALGVLIDRVSEEEPGSETFPPEVLNGIPLTSAEEVKRDEEIKGGYYGEYQSGETFISVIFWQIIDEETAKTIKDELFTITKTEFDKMFDDVNWENPQKVEVKGYQATGINYKAFVLGKLIDGGIIYAAVNDYVIFVQIIHKEGKSTLSELKSVLGVLIDKVPGIEIRVGGCTNSEATNYNSEATIDDGSCTYESKLAEAEELKRGMPVWLWIIIGLVIVSVIVAVVVVIVLTKKKSAN